VSGHRTLSEIERYTSRADQARLAQSAFAKLFRCLALLSSFPSRPASAPATHALGAGGRNSGKA
jgi:hypothetical protein